MGTYKKLRNKSNMEHTERTMVACQQQVECSYLEHMLSIDEYRYIFTDHNHCTALSTCTTLLCGYITDLDSGVKHTFDALHKFVCVYELYREQYGPFPCNTIHLRKMAARASELCKTLASCFTTFQAKEIETCIKQASDPQCSHLIHKRDVRFTLEELQRILDSNPCFFAKLTDPEKSNASLMKIYLKHNPSYYPIACKLFWGYENPEWLFYAMHHGYDPEVIFDPVCIKLAPKEIKKQVADRVKLRSKGYPFGFYPQVEDVLGFLEQCDDLAPSRWFRVNKSLRDNQEVWIASVLKFTSRRKLAKRFSQLKSSKWYASYIHIRCKRGVDVHFHFE